MANYIFTKNGSLEWARGSFSKSDFISASYGTTYTASLADTALNLYHFSSSNNFSSTDYKKIKSLKNIINFYKGQESFISYDNVFNKPISVLAFNSIHLGNGIDKDSIYLGIYYTGSLLDYATDKRLDGVLYNKDDEKVGMVLYKEGFIILSHTGTITTEVITNFTGTHYSVANEYPRWIYFGCNDDNQEKFAFLPQYSVTDAVPTNTIFINADKYKLNHSNNLTYIESGSYSYNLSTGNNYFSENNVMEIKNTVKSPFTSGSANFQKETYISKIGLYDKDKNLIGYATLATPVRKTENREFLFKLKIDI
jgi:hypothetical protein